MELASLADYTDEELEALLRDAEVHATRLEQRSAFARHEPFDFQREWYNACVNHTHEVVCLFCANQQGKSELGANVTVGRCLGAFSPGVSGVPLPREWSRGSLRGKRFLAAGETFEVSLRDTIVPKLMKFVTPDMLERPPRKNSLGIPCHWRFVTGAELVLMSYQQSVDSFEGSVWDGVWFDEPPPQDVFNAVRRGCLARSAQILITATPLKEPWMRDDLLEPSLDPEHPSYGRVVEFKADIWNNVKSKGGVIPDEEIEAYLSVLPPKERAAREFGMFMDLQGLEFDYVQKETHVVPDFEIPRVWPLVEVCDPSMKRGLFVCWFVVDEDDYWYCVQAKNIENGSFDEMHQDLQRWRDVLGHMPDVYIMDQRGGSQEVRKDIETTWFEEFRKLGTYYEKSSEVPMNILHGWMRPRWDPKREKFLPKLRMTQRVAAEERGPLWGFKRFQWNPQDSRKRQYNQPGKDWVDDFRYLAGHKGLTFRRLSRSPESSQPYRIAASYAPPPRERRGLQFHPMLRLRSRQPRYGRARTRR